MASLPPGLQQFALPSGQLAFRPSSDAADLGSRSAVQSVGMAAQQASVQLLLQTSQQISAAQSGLPSPQVQLHELLPVCQLESCMQACLR